MGSWVVLPYTAALEAKTILESSFRAFSRTFSVPRALVSKSSMGFSIEYGTTTWAAKW